MRCRLNAMVLAAALALLVIVANSRCEDRYYMGSGDTPGDPFSPRSIASWHTQVWENYIIPGEDDRAVFNSDHLDPDGYFGAHGIYLGDFWYPRLDPMHPYVVQESGDIATINSLLVESGNWTLHFGFNFAGLRWDGQPPRRGGLVVANDILVESGSLALSEIGDVFTEPEQVSIIAASAVVGTTGNGNLRIESGALAHVLTVEVRGSESASGHLTVSGEGSELACVHYYRYDDPPPDPPYIEGDLTIGSVGRGDLDVLAGARVSADRVLVGSGESATGNVTVSGAGSMVLSSGNTVIGQSGSGTLKILAGGEGHASGLCIAGSYGAGTETGNVIVSGKGSKLSTLDLDVGLAGNGTLDVLDGGCVKSCYSASIGGAIESGTGHVTVSGTGSVWNINVNHFAHCYVGFGGSGTLDILAGGVVSSAHSVVGYNNGSSGRVTASGTGSTWTTSQDLVVGRSGSGTLAIAEGGFVSSLSATVGGWELGVGEVTVTGDGSAWNSEGELQIGGSGSGTLSVEAGGQVSNTGGYVGYDQGSTGAATVTGVGSTWTSSGSLCIGRYGSGALDILDGGAVESARGSVGAFVGSAGNVTVDSNGSRWSVTQDLHVGGRWDSDEGGTGSLTLTDGGSLTVGEELILYPTGTLNVTGGRAMVGTGSLPSDFGTLLVAGGTLSGSGSILGDVVVSRGLLSPGQSPGTLQIEGDLHLESDAELLMEIAGSPNSGLFDVLDVAGKLSLGGTLEVKLLGDFQPLAGNVFDILDCSSTAGMFENVLLPSLASHLRWNLSGIYASGRLSVDYATAPADANSDGKVNDLDASILAANWQRTGGATWAQADFNGDGDVNDLDASILAANWQYGVGAAVPEPSLAVLALLGLATVALARRVRRRGL